MYTDIDSIETKLGVTLTDDQSDLFTNVIIPAIKEFVDKYTNRTFEVDSNATKTYYGNKRCYLPIDECLALDSVTAIDELGTETVIDLTDFEVEPLNELPIEALVVKPNAEYGYQRFSDYKYEIVGDWGYSTTAPTDIQLASLLLACAVWKNKGVKSESIEGYSYTLENALEENPTIKGILQSRRRILL